VSSLLRRYLDPLTGTKDCGSWHVRHRPWSPHPRQCHVPGCPEHPEIGVWWSSEPSRDVVQVLRAAGEHLPADTHQVYVCEPHGGMIGASAKAAGVGHRVLVNGLPADAGVWRNVQTVPPRVLVRWLAAVPAQVSAKGTVL